MFISWFLENDFIIFNILVSIVFFIYFAIAFSYTRDNILRLLFLFEILSLIFSFLFLIISLHYFDLYGQIVVLYILTIAAVEASIGLAMIYVYYKLWRTVKIASLKKIRG